MLLLLQHLHHRAVMFAIAAAAGRQAGFGICQQSRRGGIAGENHEQRNGDKPGHDFLSIVRILELS